MTRIIKRAATVILAVALMCIFLTATVFATETETTTVTDTIEIRTQSALLIDCSGSMTEQEAVESVLAQIDQSAFDAVVYFDQRFTTDSDFTGGGNSAICEAIDKTAKGFEHIAVVTDAEQWPQNYSALGIYTDIDLTIYLVEEDEEAKEFVEQLQSRLTNSNLKVVKPDGSEEVILDEYQAPVYEIQIQVPVIPEEPEIEQSELSVSESENEEQKVVVVDEDGKCYWWIALILAVLISALFDFIHELITRGRSEEQEKASDTTNPTPKPIPAKAVAQIAQGAHVVADFSGSMAAQQSETAKACMDAQKGSEAVICFGDSVSEHTADELKGIQAAGKTAGWEALEKAFSRGWDEIVLVSDLGFNGKTFDEKAFPKKFKKVTVVTPSNYYAPTLENLKKIANEVEVLPLQ